MAMPQPAATAHPRQGRSGPREASVRLATVSMAILLPGIYSGLRHPINASRCLQSAAPRPKHQEFTGIHRMNRVMAEVLTLNRSQIGRVHDVVRRPCPRPRVHE